MKSPTPNAEAATADGLAGIARHIAAHFKIQCDRQYILRWRQDKEHKFSKPFPTPDSANRFVIADCLAWVEKFYLPNIDTASEALFMEARRAEAETTITKNKTAQRNWEILNGDYIARDLATSTGIAAVKTFHQLVKAEDERSAPKLRRDKLKQLKVKPEIIAQFFEWDQQLGREMTERRENQMAVLADGHSAEPK